MIISLLIIILVFLIIILSNQLTIAENQKKIAQITLEINRKLNKQNDTRRNLRRE